MSSKKDSEAIKKMVLQKYDGIAKTKHTETESACCSTLQPSGCGETDYEVFADDYSALDGYQSDADLGLGCGLPTEFAKIETGHTVVDLGSGAGNDCFVARQIAGESGRVIGIDFSPSMIERARQNAGKRGYTNMEFLPGDIEEISLPDNTADVVVSNCVLNLVPDKLKAYSETFRILKPGGHFSISDIVTEGDLPTALKKSAELYAGCVAGAIDINEYLDVVKAVGFKNVRIQKKKLIQLPETLLHNYLPVDDVKKFIASKMGIYSITIFGIKPVEQADKSKP